MAYVKDVMINTLRDSTENNTLWQLRRAFLQKNWRNNVGPEFKEHLIELSHCFVSVALGKAPEEFPEDIYQEARHRSWGLESHIDKALYDSEVQNAKQSYYGQGQRDTPSSSYYYQGSQYNQQNYTSYSQGPPPGSYYDEDEQFSSSSYGQGQQDTAADYYGYNNRASASFYGQDQDVALLLYGQNQQGAIPFDYDQMEQNTPSPYGQDQWSKSSYRKRKHQSTSSNGKHYGLIDTPFPKVKKNFADPNTLSVIPTKKPHPHTGVPSKKALKKEKRRSEAMTKITSSFIKPNTGATESNGEADHRKEFCIDHKRSNGGGSNSNGGGSNSNAFESVKSSFKHQPIFDNISCTTTSDVATNEESVNYPSTCGDEGFWTGPDGMDFFTVSKVPSSKGTVTVDSSSSSNDTVNTAKETSTSVYQPTTNEKPDIDSKPNSVSTSNKIEISNKSVEEQEMNTLDSIFKMASHYSTMEKDSIDPYTCLQKCAANTKQKVKCVSKSTISSEGHKELMCQVFANEICLVSVLVTTGTNPEEAKKKLAVSVLEKINLPYLRIVSDEGVKRLEGSVKPFEEKDVSAGDGKTTEDDSHVNSSELTSDTNIKKDPTSSLGWNLAPTVENDDSNFDSYVAWRCENHPSLKKIRQLGHMYQTLPFPIYDPVVILQCLSNVSSIQLVVQQVHETDDNESSSSSYNMVMDGEILLVSRLIVCGDPARFISNAVLQKVSMPYLCLKAGALQSSNVPFPQVTDDAIVHDRWSQRKAEDEKYLRPIRLKNFCILQLSNPNALVVLTKTAAINGVNLDMNFRDKKGTGQSHCRVTINGRTVGQDKSVKRKSARLRASESCIKHLRKCHWTVCQQKLPQHDKMLFPCDVMKDDPEYEKAIQTESVSLESSNMGHKLLTKLGWSGGGIGKKEDGITEPISVKMLASNSGLGHKKSAGPSNISKMANNEKVRHKELLKAYAESSYHRELYIPCLVGCQRGNIFSMVHSMNLKASTRGTRHNKRVVISKNFDNRTLFMECFVAGGMSDKFVLVPPQEVDYEDEHLAQCKKKKKKNKKQKMSISAESEKVRVKGVQCDLLDAPPLKLEVASIKEPVKIVYDLEDEKAAEVAYDLEDEEPGEVVHDLEDDGEGEWESDRVGFNEPLGVEEKEDDNEDDDEERVDNDGGGNVVEDKVKSAGVKNRKRQTVEMSSDIVGAFKRLKNI